MLIANEVVDSTLKKRDYGMMCKLNIVSLWSCELRLFASDSWQDGFRAKWIIWIKWCISLANFSVLINGSPIGLFQRSRGLRQWPLVDCSWNLGMVVIFQDSRLGKEGVGWRDISFPFCEASQEQVTFLCWLLIWFEAMLGLKINLEKSEMVLVGEVDNVENLACKIGCKVGKLPSSYLRLP